MCRCHLSYTFMYAPGTKMTKNNTQFQYSGWKGKAVLVPPSDNNVPWKWALPLPRRWILHYYKLQIIHLQRAIFETCDLWDICCLCTCDHPKICVKFFVTDEQQEETRILGVEWCIHFFTFPAVSLPFDFHEALLCSQGLWLLQALYFQHVPLGHYPISALLNKPRNSSQKGNSSWNIVHIAENYVR